MKLIRRKLCAVLCAALLAGVLVPPARAAVFTDVPDGHWAKTYISRLAETGVMGGVGNNKFEPNRTVANCEMTKIK